ncbi:hypothetical protein ANCCEY_06307 [Ancylostoma ceylanicum]|uniref:Uncharacterized protein n=2 Tax=Ancylostoma ceylanicum TaxID=53326 RepID=A0A0D6M3U3_9BILA|nr:hypothetical protein ANCCEY_06307 [Ancylostoma ceylanicum]EYC27222.1 hypothetical protein Y032_0009g586 [Ancylostoma ceylanicum]
MKTLLAVLALCALAYTKNCPELIEEITQENINDVNTVALVTVYKGPIGSENVYDLYYHEYYDVKGTGAPLVQRDYQSLKTDCGLELEDDTEYYLGCKTENSDCKFLKPLDELTPEEEKLLNEQ